MIAVAFGHWMAIAVYTDDAGALTAGNALELAPGMSWVTWILQVMPLFFVVGGFSSAMSLDSFAARGGGRPQDWVIARLHRMLAPAVVLASAWAVFIAAGYAVGQGALIATGATAAAIPLWFLANYTIDTAIAPYVLPAFRRHRIALPAGGVALFCALEAARFAGVPALPQLNWILGWLLFQVAGFAWRDGLLPRGKALLGIAGGFWTLAFLAVTVGPYPVAMVHFPGLVHSPTHPPSLALMLFGAGYSLTAVAAAPAISAWLATRPKAWAGVVAANAIAMSVYLWHFTAAIVVTAGFHAAGWLPTSDVGSALWWVQKVPFVMISAIVLGLIVAKVAPVEQKALLAPRHPWVGGRASMMLLAAVLSTALKQWAHGDFVVATVCIGIVITLWHTCIKPDALVNRSI